MKRNRTEAEQQPEGQSSTTNVLQVSKTRDPNIEPWSCRMCFIDLFPIGCGHALHAITATAEQDGTEHIDEYVEPGIEFLDTSTVPLA